MGANLGLEAYAGVAKIVLDSWRKKSEYCKPHRARLLRPER